MLTTIEFRKLLRSCIVTRENYNIIYRFNGKIVLQYMNSSGDVYVDSEFMLLIPMYKEHDFAMVIRELIDNVRVITFGIDLNEYVETRKEIISTIFEKYIVIPNNCCTFVLSN